MRRKRCLWTLDQPLLPHAMLPCLVSDGGRNRPELGRPRIHPVVENLLYFCHVHGREELEDPRNSVHAGPRLLDSVDAAENPNVTKRRQERPSFELLGRAPDSQFPLFGRFHALHIIHRRSPPLLGLFAPRWPRSSPMRASLAASTRRRVRVRRYLMKHPGHGLEPVLLDNRTEYSTKVLLHPQRLAAGSSSR